MFAGNNDGRGADEHHDCGAGAGRGGRCDAPGLAYPERGAAAVFAYGATRLRPRSAATLRYTSFDALYEAHDRFEEVYEAIIAQLLLAAREGDVVYAVPGDPLVGEATTTGLLAAARAEGIALHVVNGVSFVEPLLAQLGVDALDGLQLLDGLQVAAMHHPPLNPAFPALLAQLYSTAVASDVKLTLMNQYPRRLHAAAGACRRHARGTG